VKSADPKGLSRNNLLETKTAALEPNSGAALKAALLRGRTETKCKVAHRLWSGATLTGDKTFGFAPAESITAEL